MPEKDTQDRPGIKTFLSWVMDSYAFFHDSRLESLIDNRVFDGKQWTAKQTNTLSNELGIHPITINKTFPAVNLILGSQALTRHDVLAKGRSTEDSANYTEDASEALKFVDDQNEGSFKKSEAFKSSIISGFGCLEVLKNYDPRQEIVKIAMRDWKEILWDPHASPWFDVDSCRYTFHQKFIDIGDLVAAFPGKKKEIENAYTVVGSSPDAYAADFLFQYDDEDDSDNNAYSYWESFVWSDKKRKRVRPVQMWYSVWEKASFATFPDGRVIELTDDMPFNEQFQVAMAAQEVSSANVRKMRVATFLGNEILQDVGTPHNHDQFPYVPYIAYLDRHQRPYGVPRQIRDMDYEINKRRTSGLAKLNARTVFVEEGVVKDLNKLRAEIARPDTFVVVNKGKLQEGRIKVEDYQGDIRNNIVLGQEAARDLQEISGAVSELMGFESNLVSGKAQEIKQRAGATVLAPIFDNVKRSDTRLGYLVMSAIQQHWKKEKVIRVTDKLRGGDKNLIFNQEYLDDTGNVNVKNNITQGKYDIVVTRYPQTDTIREKMFDLLSEAIKASPPEAVPQLIDIAFEQIDLPNKDIILTRLRQTFNLAIPDQNLTKEQLESQLREQRAVQAEKDAETEKLQTEEQSLKNEKILAQIKRLLAQIELDKSEAEKIDTEKELSIAKDTREDETHDLEIMAGGNR
uniref:Putative portal protein n=1 Tax=viral metagenome TaxID=1070528 RepID=A0A6M3XIY6_9ZZZZ